MRLRELCEAALITSLFVIPGTSNVDGQHDLKNTAQDKRNLATVIYTSPEPTKTPNQNLPSPELFGLVPDPEEVKPPKEIVTKIKKGQIIKKSSFPKIHQYH